MPNKVIRQSNYVDSITLDEEVTKAAYIIENKKVRVNVNNGGPIGASGEKTPYYLSNRNHKRKTPHYLIKPL
jgi:hypothetical protein